MKSSGRIVGRLASCASSSVCHPFLFSANAVLIDWLSNSDQVQPYVVVLPLLLSLLVAGGLYLTARYVFKDRFLAGLLATVALLAFLHYGFIVDSLQGLPGAALLKWIPLLAAAAILAETFAMARRHPGFAQRLNPVLNLVSAVWVVMAVVPLVSAQLEVLSLRARYLEAQPANEVDTLPDASNRDVYYIILDGYGRSDELVTDYQFDNSSFIGELRQMGFVVPECTLSNYAFTALSLASSLNMQYMDDLGLGEREDHATVEYRELANAINYSGVQRRFERMGYRTVTVNNGIQWAQLNGADHLNPSGTASNVLEYSYHFLSKTAFRLFPSPNLNLLGTVKYRRTLEVLDALQTIPQSDGPTFAFIHILAPHAPFVFGQDGAYVRDWATSAVTDGAGYRAQYRDEVTYLNGRLLDALAAIIAQSETPPVIVIQGDHSWSLSDQTQMQILNAYYLPDGGADRLYSQVTPVNTFRLVLDYYFGEENGLVEDRSYFSSLLESPYAFEEYAGNCAELPADRYPSLFSSAVELAPGADWSNVRQLGLADVNGDSKSDILGFAPEGVVVALSGGAEFGMRVVWTDGFRPGVDWDESWPRLLGDVNGDGMSDIVGIAPGGVIVSLSNGAGFDPGSYWTREFRTGVNWDESWPRLLGDVSGDGMLDIVGVAPAGVVVSLSNGAGFDPGGYWTKDFRADRDWTAPWPLLLGDVNGDGKSDLIGLSAQGTTVVLSDGSSFEPRHPWMYYAGLAQRWQDPWPVVATDIDGDGKSDLMAFTPDGASLAISTGESFLLSSRFWIWGGDDAVDWPDPREVVQGDIDGDGRADVIGFGPDHVIVSYGSHP